MSQYIKTPQGPQEPQGTPPAGPAQRGAQRSGAAVFCFFFGLISVFCLGPIFGIPALIAGFVSLRTIGRSDGQVTGKVFAISGICLALIGVTWGSVSTYYLYKGFKDTPSTSSRSYQKSPLEIAEDNIRLHKGQVGFGNTPEAAALANEFASKMKILRESFFTGESKGGLSGGEFLTHCELKEDRCAFIVHVPGLRKFDSEAKESLCDIAWTIAQTSLAESNLPEGFKLAVGVKGIALYEDIMTGSFSNEGEAERRSLGTSSSALEPFFRKAPTRKKKAVKKKESSEEMIDLSPPEAEAPSGDAVDVSGETPQEEASDSTQKPENP